MTDYVELVEWLRDRAFRKHGPKMEAPHIREPEWKWADAIEALTKELASLREIAKGAAEMGYDRGYREGLEKAAQIADGEAHADCDVAEQIAKFIRALIPE